MFERQLEAPLYPKTLWQRPISRSAAGRLVVVGGHQGGVAKLQATYQIATAAGIGQSKLVVPDTLRPLLGGLPDVTFAPSSPSGSLGKGAVGAIDELGNEADAVLLGPDASNNSETLIAFEKFTGQTERPLILSDDGLELLAVAPDLVCGRPRPC